MVRSPSYALSAILICAGACRFTAGRELSPAPDGGQKVDAPAQDALPGLTAIRVEPAEATVTIRQGVAATQGFKAIGVFSGGKEMDITDRVAWTSSNPGLGAVDATGLVTTGRSTGGKIYVTADNGGLSGRATLSIRLELSAVSAEGSPALPPDPAGKLAGPPNATAAPELVYPNDGVVLPPNLNGVEVHFRRGRPENTLFEIAFSGPLVDLRVFTRCVALGDGCRYQPPRDVWSALAETNRGQGSVSLTVRGTDDAGTAVGTSKPFAVWFSQDTIRGALYYWTTSEGGAIKRWNFGDLAQTTAEPVIDSTTVGGHCPGCHVLSRDGKKMMVSVTQRGVDVGFLLLWGVVQKQPLVPFPLTPKALFGSWNPDGTSFVLVDGNHGQKGLVFLDGSGTRTGALDLGATVPDHPDWSADGNKIAFTDVGKWVGSDQYPGKSGISWVEGGSGAWSPVKVLVPQESGKNNYYPAISPDNRFVVFDRSTCAMGSEYDGGCDADTDPGARLHAVRFPPASATLIDLARANAPGVADGADVDLATSYPKWSPFVFQLTEQRRIMWMTFSSRRHYGLHPIIPGQGGRPSTTLIWMVAVEPDQLPMDVDPSAAAFCLPFQDLATSNHIAQWTSDVPVIP